MSTMYQVKVNDEIRTYEEGTSFEVIAKDFSRAGEASSALKKVLKKMILIAKL